MKDAYRPRNIQYRQSLQNVNRAKRSLRVYMLESIQLSATFSRNRSKVPNLDEESNPTLPIRAPEENY